MPEGLLAAFDAYEAALAADDVPALADAFASGDTTLRGDANGLLVGHDAITAFRGRRGGAPARGIVELHVRVLGADRALIVSVNAPRSGGRGLVTQLWSRAAGVWQVEAAQVGAPAPAVNSSIWRVIGSPLVSATGSGPLDGQTVAVKDLFAIEHFAIGAGIPAYLADAPVQTATAPALAVLLAAGAAVRGIAQTDEFAYSIAGRNSGYGTPPNAAVPGAIPGGSSSGPASAVALGHASIGLATDTAGSIRVPASYQGLWGIRTSHGAVSVEGLLPLAPSFDTVGWLTRDAETLAAAARVSLPADSATLRPEFVTDPALLATAAPAVRDAFLATVDALVTSGAILPPASVELGPLPDMFEAFRLVQAAEAWRSDGEWIAAHPGSLAPDVQSRFDLAATIDAETEARMRVRVAGYRARLISALADRVLLLPSASSPAPSLNASAAEIDAARSATLAMTCVAGIGGYPAVSAPLMSVGSAPVGLCLVGPVGTDQALIALAARLA
ncbi:DUF3225 domain-containing protein [Microbacteriaceae bacterium VKM Ac-2854]|nr:DUF3225 domain-containing protein [Microbacteriaceae bacterium VKM Ac-2854]